MANSLEELNGRRHFDYIVVGCGGVGSGTTYWLSKLAGPNVLALEKFQLGHVNGGSQDVSRIIRLAYHDDRYTKLSPHAYACWDEVEKESGMQVVFKCGGLNLSETEETHDVLEKYADAMKRHNIDYEWWDHKQLMEHYPQFTVGPGFQAIYQKDSGLVDAALAMSMHVQLAQGNGAKVIDRCPVTRLARHSSGVVEVNTPLGTFTCKKVIVTSGAWINQVISSVGCHVPIYVSQENVTYFGTPHIKEFTKEKFPIFLYHTHQQDIYALPAHVIGGSKIGVDAGGDIVTGDTRNFTPDPKRLKYLQDTMQRICPKFLGPEMLTKTCLYTMTPDRHFTIGTCKKTGFDDVVVCCGAGHAFKYSSILGKILSELAFNGQTQYDISGFSWDREAMTNPNYEPHYYFKDDAVQSKL